MSNNTANETPTLKRERGFIKRLLGLIGINFPYDKWYKIYIAPRFFMLIAVAGLLGAIGMGIMYQVSTTPSFCRMCHIMEPYYQAWVTSSHKDHATCVTCHYPVEGGAAGIIQTKLRAMSQVTQYITRSYSPRPAAEVEDSNCLQKGCHETRLLDGKIKMKGGKINFDHTPHLTQMRRGKELRCTSCHSQIMVGTHMEVTLTSCYNCHFKGHKPGRDTEPLAGCLKCHVPPETPLNLGAGLTFNHQDYITKDGVKCIFCHVDSVKGDGTAPKERCSACHNSPERLVLYENTDFIHKMHVSDKNVECQSCHLAIEHKIHASAPQEGTCNQCHQPSHNAVLKMFKGEWPGREESPEPSTMQRSGLHCIACHEHRVGGTEDQPFAPVSWKTDGKSCETCHGEGFAEFLTTWKTDIAAAVARVEPLAASIKSKVSSTPEGDPNLQKLKQLSERAKLELEFVKFGRGEHNYELTVKRLAQLESDLKLATGAQ